jgi:hypothetical protein
MREAPRRRRPRAGSAIDPTTYDYEGAVPWNWHAPALWNRFVIELVRVLAAHVGLSERAWRQASAWRMRKVAELQARGLGVVAAAVIDIVDHDAAVTGIGGGAPAGFPAEADHVGEDS